MITFANVALRRGTQLLFEDATFTIHAGERVGVVGRNGTGKSSLFAALDGELAPDVGEIGCPSKATITSIAQHMPREPRTAVEYAIDGDRHLREIEARLAEAEARGAGGEVLADLHARYEEADGYTAHARAARILSGLGFGEDELDTNTLEFSGGWRMRLNLARALMAPSDILLLDEPTNHLDFEAIVWLERWLARYPGTLLIISHDRDFLDAAVGRILNIRDQHIEEYKGNYSAFESALVERLNQEAALRTRQLEERARIQKFVDRFRAKATKARQAQSRVKMLERMETVAAANVDTPFTFTFESPTRMPNPLITLDDVAVGYADTPILNRVTVTLTPGSRIGIVGVNGAGKSTLIKLLHGDLAPLSGRRVEHPGLSVGYFAQHQLEQLDGKASPKVLMKRIAPRTEEQALRNFLGGFGFAGERYDTPCETFSGGEKSRLILATLIWSKPNLLLLDEPTNHLDMDMRAALTLALQEFEGALIVIAHDRHLLRSTTDVIWRVADGTVTTYDGDVADYQSLQGDASEGTTQPNGSLGSTPAPRRQRSKQEAAMHRKSRLPLLSKSKKIEAELEKQQRQIRDIDELLSTTKISGEEMATTLKQRASLASGVEELEMEWLDVQEAIETMEREFEGRA
ncbi:MAG: ATP-binding cassette domain-containing protein [Gammaproteobacteria bacterium]|nr:ATP-binding cassette domain-containing protein [Gammaproteobacteria bacterium]